MEEKLLSPYQVAERLGIKSPTVANWLRAGRMSGLKIGNKGLWRVREQTLDTFLTEAQAQGSRRKQEKD